MLCQEVPLAAALCSSSSTRSTGSPPAVTTLTAQGQWEAAPGVRSLGPTQQHRPHTRRRGPALQEQGRWAPGARQQQQRMGWEQQRAQMARAGPRRWQLRLLVPVGLQP
jgi:hypothetical protein